MRYFLIIATLLFSIHSSAMENLPREAMVDKLSQFYFPRLIAMVLREDIAFTLAHAKEPELGRGFSEILLELVTKYYTKSYKGYLEKLSETHLQDLYVLVSQDSIYQFEEALVNSIYLRPSTEQPSMPCENLEFLFPWLEKHYFGALTVQKSVGLHEERAKLMLVPQFNKLRIDFMDEISFINTFKEKYPNHDADFDLILKDFIDPLLKEVEYRLNDALTCQGRPL